MVARFRRRAAQSLAAGGESLATHRDGRGALPARRDDREYREYLSEEQRSRRGCIARRMQPDFHHGLLGCVPKLPRHHGGHGGYEVQTCSKRDFSSASSVVESLILQRALKLRLPWSTMKQRWALVVMGAWLMGTICMSIVATENFYTIDRLLADRANPAFASAVDRLGSPTGRDLLRYLSSELNRLYFQIWKITQLALGGLAFLLRAPAQTIKPQQMTNH